MLYALPFSVTKAVITKSPCWKNEQFVIFGTSDYSIIINGILKSTFQIIYTFLPYESDEN